jgi:signal recognition particle subunit SRP54
MVRKMGPIGNILGMLPGAAQNRELLSQVSDKDLDRAAAIVNSMTPQERRNPKIINGSRRARVASGAGVQIGEVSQLIVRFLEGQKMMRQMMGSMPGMPGMRRQSKTRGKAKKKGKGGGRPTAGRAGAGRGGRPADQRAAAAGGPDGLGAVGQAGDFDPAAPLPGGAGGNPSALPGGFSGLPGFGGGKGGLKLPMQPGQGQQNVPAAFRGRPGKKGR